MKMKRVIDYFGGEKKFYIIMIVLILMWLGVMTLFYLKADEVTKDPCSICAKKMGERIICKGAITDAMPITRQYYPNFTIVQGFLPE